MEYTYIPTEITRVSEIWYGMKIECKSSEVNIRALSRGQNQLIKMAIGDVITIRG